MTQIQTEDYDPKILLGRYLKRVLLKNGDVISYKYTHWDEDQRCSQFSIRAGSICYRHPEGREGFGPWNVLLRSETLLKSVRMVTSRSKTGPIFLLMKPS